MKILIILQVNVQLTVLMSGVIWILVNVMHNALVCIDVVMHLVCIDVVNYVRLMCACPIDFVSYYAVE